MRVAQRELHNKNMSRSLSRSNSKNSRENVRWSQVQVPVYQCSYDNIGSRYEYTKTRSRAGSPMGVSVMTTKTTG